MPLRDDNPRPPASPAPSSSPRLRPLWVAVYVCFLVLVALAGLKTWRDLSVVEARADELRHEIVHSEAAIEELEHRLEALDDDPRVLERLAREELGMVHPDDIVVILPPEAPPPPIGPPTEPPSGH